MIKVKLNNIHETILNTHRFVVGMVSHNKILSVNEVKFMYDSLFFFAHFQIKFFKVILTWYSMMEICKTLIDFFPTGFI